ncbi:MAG: hypothetical protein JRG74_14375 [Deltaproteobacteria bacterium]|nr:hypothetical protein [Deltaproteobacteria bacterium]MBW2167219.1 hypothetical protein [Deltaproteobacteria bacterium]
MKTRLEFETPRTPAEMKTLIDEITEDRESISDADYHRRPRGIVKDLIEEYAPLQVLAEHTESDCKAYLMPVSNQGPDGVIELSSGKKMMIQVTVADQDHQTAMGRERLSEGHITIPASTRTRNPTTKGIEEQGRILTTRKARLQEQISKIVTAVQQKNDNFHEGTDILLVSANIFLSDEDLDHIWEDDLRAHVMSTGSPYPRICIDIRKEIIDVYP